MHSFVRVLPLAIYVTCLASACGEHGVSGSPASQPSDFADELRARSPVDLDPDPNVLEIELEARVADIEFIPGAPTTAWTYDGGVPGPLIRAKVGDRVRVHFKNSLPEPTSIHWHGLRIPMAMDGVPEHGQAPVPPGGSFDYEFTLPDAGTFWYHPHFASAAQVGNGLYGPLIVDDPNEPRGIGDEVVLMLSDIALNPDGTLIAGDVGGDDELLAGREGSLLLVNGRVNPTLRAADGLRQRLRIINAAKTRYFDLALDAHDFLRIGGDGRRANTRRTRARRCSARSRTVADLPVAPITPNTSSFAWTFAPWRVNPPVPSPRSPATCASSTRPRPRPSTCSSP
jgi:FtsP/CotA-like multicopper oxidase with cupredoxin domain